MVFVAMLVEITVALTVLLLGCIYRSIKPPTTKLCGGPGGPPVTSPRIKLSDGRYMAYKERGCSKEKARYKVIVCHGIGDSKDTFLPYSQELLEQLGVYLLTYDRPGYGESDPDPKRTLKSLAYDIEELADKLELGPKFHVFGFSMGASVAWSCLIYIPHRLAGLGLGCPMVNYYWRGLPAKLANECFKALPVRDQWSLRVAHYTPWLFHWWMTQKWFPAMIQDKINHKMFTHKDIEVFGSWEANKVSTELLKKAVQQGAHVSVHQDMISGFGKWEIEPTDIANPFPDNEGKVHVWQGFDDRIIPYKLNRAIVEKLPWIQYHELPDSGHMFFHYPEFREVVLRETLLG